MPKNNSRAMREQRREQAETRQKAYAALTDDEKLERIKSRPGFSLRERLRVDGELVEALEAGAAQIQRGEGIVWYGRSNFGNRKGVPFL